MVEALKVLKVVVQLFHQLLLPAEVMAAEVGIVQMLEDQEVLAAEVDQEVLLEDQEMILLLHQYKVMMEMEAVQT